MSTAVSTCQFIRIETKEGRAALRKIANGGEWRASARDQTGWKIEFTRIIRGEIGEPDVEVVVMTDCEIRFDGYFGRVQSFHDAKEVIVPKPTRLCAHDSRCRLLARLISEGYSIQIVGSGGSTTSSNHGLALVYVNATHPKHPHCGLTLDDTIYVDGRRVCSGMVD